MNIVVLKEYDWLYYECVDCFEECGTCEEHVKHFDKLYGVLESTTTAGSCSNIIRIFDHSRGYHRYVFCKYGFEIINEYK